jgi:group II intron reverse transcriptase/maturase
MRNANTVLSIIRDRGKRGLPLEDVYRQLYNPELYLLAYGKIARNQGAMTPGVTSETADGMSLDKIQAIIDAVRYERYRWKPAKRIYIEKKGSIKKKRPLGLPSWSDKVLQEVIRTILDAYYEPRFSDRSHGFRPMRGCHTALQTIYRSWRGTNWFIEGDISACFDSLNHEIMLEILRQDIHDNRFIRLLESLCKAGYLEDWTYHNTLSGVPQGGVVSPILSNIYLDRLDQFVESTLLPEYNRGKERERNPAYYRLTAAVSRARRVAKDRKLARALAKQARAMPTRITDDPTYRRLHYVRYADDFLLGLCGTRAEAEAIKQQLGEFLGQTLRLQLSEAKTLVTHAVTERHSRECQSSSLCVPRPSAPFRSLVSSWRPVRAWQDGHSHGQSEVGFVFSFLLGFQLLHRYRVEQMCRARRSPQPCTPRQPMRDSNVHSPAPYAGWSVPW